ncbi:hypothetical protein [Pseudoxanthomonas sp. PXM04]|uniref:hypothetical protein n=1 Tax=Pseudoxanthomonas sp. PXM04 TaxID=2769297 RepID=UPI0017838337|nr:hypothetical protein [Pseudoxanthomonas sp. PXM04]MBD9376158.1 hypothetical protein [Pseudoxanthomonas sp. PXM04]
MDQLFPRPPRRMKQPTKDQLRAQLVQAASEIERLQGALANRWWRRLARRLRRQEVRHG